MSPVSDGTSGGQAKPEAGGALPQLVHQLWGRAALISVIPCLTRLRRVAANCFAYRDGTMATGSMEATREWSIGVQDDCDAQCGGPVRNTARSNSANQSELADGYGRWKPVIPTLSKNMVRI